MKKAVLVGLFSLMLSCTSLSWADGKRTIVSVWDFDNISFMDIAQSDYLAKALAEMLMTQLSQSPSLEVVERVHLRETLEEQKIGSSDLADEDAKIKLGKIFGSRYMVFGAFMVLEEQARVDVRVVDVQTSEILLAEKFEGDLTELMPNMESITEKVVNHFGVVGSGKKLTGDIKQWKEYEVGLGLIDVRKYEEALGVFQVILEKTPDFYAAEKQIKLIIDLMARQ